MFRLTESRIAIYVLAASLASSTPAYAVFFTNSAGQTLAGPQNGQLQASASNAEGAFDTDMATFGGVDNFQGRPSSSGGANGAIANVSGARSESSGSAAAFANGEGSLQATSSAQGNGSVSADVNDLAIAGAIGGINGVDVRLANATVTADPGNTPALLFGFTYASASVTTANNFNAAANGAGLIDNRGVTVINNNGFPILLDSADITRVSGDQRSAAGFLALGENDPANANVMLATTAQVILGDVVSGGLRQGSGAGIGSAFVFWTPPPDSTTAETFALTSSPMPIFGDFNLDFALDDGDIDLLAATIASDGGTVFPKHIAQDVYVEGANPFFDLNLDTIVDSDDLVSLVQDELLTAFGDTDLDGDVDAADVSTVTSNFNTAGGWADGDVSGDGFIDSADFSVIASNFGFDRNAPSVAVPEPSTTVSIALVALAAFASRRST